MQTFNKTMILGYVGQDVEVIHIGESTKKVAMSIATNHKVKGELVATWHTAIFFDKQAEMVANIKKGDALLVEGRMAYRKYTNKEGVEKVSPEIIVDNFSVTKGEINWPNSDAVPEIPY